MSIDPEWKKAGAESENTFMDGQPEHCFHFLDLQRIGRQISDSRTNKDAVGRPRALRFCRTDSSSDYYTAFLTYLKKFVLLFDTEGVAVKSRSRHIQKGAIMLRWQV